MNPEKKYGILHEFLVILLVIVLAKQGTRLWPISLALLLTLLVHGVRKLILRRKRRMAVSAEPSQPQPEPARPLVPAAEQDLIAAAFGLLQRRITEAVAAVYPGARWIWERPGARERFAAGETLVIQLNCAGGYQSAMVQVCNLQFYGLSYLPAAADPEEEEDTEEPPEEDGPESIEYGLLAFEWAEANLQRLNGLAEDARLDSASPPKSFPAEELPHGDSWPALCKVLMRSGFDHAEPVADGILITFKPDEKE